jgi:hypothetical protein
MARIKMLYPSTLVDSMEINGAIKKKGKRIIPSTLKLLKIELI